MRELEGSLKIISNAGVLQYICKGIAFTLVIAVTAVVLGIMIGSILALARNYCNGKISRIFQMVGDCLHRSISEYTVAIMDFCLRGVLSLPEVSKS